jgi:hypothetical protein
MRRRMQVECWRGLLARDWRGDTHLAQADVCGVVSWYRPSLTFIAELK